MLSAIQNQSKSTTATSSDLDVEMNPKLLCVLKKLIEPNFKLNNNDYLNLLLTHLTKFEDSPEELKNIKNILYAWLVEAVMKFERIKDPPNSQILAFYLNISTYLCKREQTFVQLSSEDIFERLLTIIKKVSQPNVMVAMIKMFSSFMGHKSGLQWIISMNHWELLLNIILNSETLYVSKEGNIFLIRLIEKSIVFNETFCLNIIQHILIPLDNASKSMADNLTFQIDFKPLFSTIGILNDIILTLLEESYDKAVILLFIEKCNLEKRIRILINLAKDAELKTELVKTLAYIGLHGEKLKYAGLESIPVAKLEDSKVILDVLYEASEMDVLSMMKLLYAIQNAWVKIRKVMPICINTNQKKFTFDDQTMCLHVLPIVAIFLKKVGPHIFNEESSDHVVDDLRSNFLIKIDDKSYSKIVRLRYKYIEYLVDNFSFDNGVLSLRYLVHSKNLYPRENGILLFQMLIYLIRDLNTHLQKHPQAQIDFLNEPEYLALHLKLIDNVIEEFKLTWKDSVEALFILNQMHNLLNGFIWPTKIVVNALKLAERAISKYMTCQMALLIDGENSIMNEFAPLLKVKLHDGAWEVRDTTVELIHQFAITTIQTKFKSFKKIILENEFPVAMIRMATSDGNSFVRASALKCLQDIIKLEAFWNCINSYCNIHETILKILQMETEGIVRSEAATLVECIYDHQKIPEELITKFYDAMNHAVVADLHWEVRVNALKFWKRVINDRLTQQGMIDGSFPTVTFSKQLKKIVTLSPVEVSKRLVTVLVELSQIGCLSVFYEAIHDESDLEVSKYATKAIFDFVSLLKQFDVSIQSLNNLISTTSLRESEGIKCSVINPYMIETQNNPNQMELLSDTIMDEILDAKDINLLESVFNLLDTPVEETIEMKKCTILPPEKFLDLIYSDLESRLNEKTRVVEDVDSFQSLLDDILKEYEPTNINSMDCY